MKILHIIKTSNEIEDISIVYGLAYLLETSGFDYTIKQMKSKYIIESDFEIEDVEWHPLELDDLNMLPSTTNKSNKLAGIRKMNDFFGRCGVISALFNYYITLDREYLKKAKITSNPRVSSVGSQFYTLGLRGGSKQDNANRPIHIKKLSYLGFSVSVSLIKNDSLEINSIIVPKYAEEILKPFTFGYTDKEEGIYKAITMSKGTSETELLLNVILETNMKYQYIKEDIEKIIIMTWTPAGNSPLANKTYDLKMKDWGLDTLYDLNSGLFRHRKNQRMLLTIANFVMDSDYKNFGELIEQYAINNSLLQEKHREDLIGGMDRKIQDVYKNEAIQKMGKGLNRLIYRQKGGYDSYSKLLSVANTADLQLAILTLGQEYSKAYNFSLVSQDELLDVIGLSDSSTLAKVIANAIMAGRVFIDFNKKTKEE